MEVALQKKISESHNKFEDLIRMAKNSEEGMYFLYSSLSNLVEPLQKIMPAMRLDKQDEYESFFGNKIPNHSHKCTISSQHCAEFQALLHKTNFIEQTFLFHFILNTQVHYIEGTIAIANTFSIHCFSSELSLHRSFSYAFSCYRISISMDAFPSITLCVAQ